MRMSRSVEAWRRLRERLEGDGPALFGDWLDEVNDISFTMKELSACGLGMAAPTVVESLMRYFPDAVSQQIRPQ